MARGGHATTSPKFQKTVPGTDPIYAILFCTWSKCLPTERQESSTSICRQGFEKTSLWTQRAQDNDQLSKFPSETG